MILKKWTEIGKIDEITGDPIPFADARGAHIKPDTDGGKIEYDNLMITTEFHNDRMGSTNALEYKKTFLAENHLDDKEEG